MSGTGIPQGFEKPSPGASVRHRPDRNEAYSGLTVPGQNDFISGFGPPDQISQSRLRVGHGNLYPSAFSDRFRSKYSPNLQWRKWTIVGPCQAIGTRCLAPATPTGGVAASLPTVQSGTPPPPPASPTTETDRSGSLSPTGTRHRAARA